MTWDELLYESALREGDLDILEPREQEPGIPLITKDTLEALHYEAACRMLRTIDPHKLQAIGSAAVNAVSAANPYTLERGTVSVVSVTVQQDDGVEFVPTIFCTPQQWYQSFNATDEDLCRWTIMDRKIHFRGGNGDFASIVTIVEPSMALFQADVAILPPGTEEERLNWVHHIIQTMNFLPAGRV